MFQYSGCSEDYFSWIFYLMYKENRVSWVSMIIEFLWKKWSVGSVAVCVFTMKKGTSGGFFRIHTIHTLTVSWIRTDNIDSWLWRAWLGCQERAKLPLWGRWRGGRMRGDEAPSISLGLVSFSNKKWWCHQEAPTPSSHRTDNFALKGEAETGVLPWQWWLQNNWKIFLLVVWWLAAQILRPSSGNGNYIYGSRAKAVIIYQAVAGA